MTAPAWGRFPDFGEDFKYAEIADDSLRNQLIEETVAARMEAFWGALVHTAHRELPGLGKENRASRVYWLSGHQQTPLRVDLSPTRSFYPFIGLTGPIGEGWRQERCLTLDIWLSPPSEILEGRNAELAVNLEITRSRPIRALLRMWRENRQDLRSLISISGAGLDFGFGDHRDPEALDEYRLDPSRKHRLMMVWRTGEPTDQATLARTFTSLARIYHVLQGILRGDSRRVSLLAQ
jgi:hypothetical protein